MPVFRRHFSTARRQSQTLGRHKQRVYFNLTGTTGTGAPPTVEGASQPIWKRRLVTTSKGGVYRKQYQWILVNGPGGGTRKSTPEAEAPVISGGHQPIWRRRLVMYGKAGVYRKRFQWILVNGPGAAVGPATAGTAVITGTVSDGATPEEIVAGGQTIVITLANDTWVAGAAFYAQRQAIIDGLNSDKSEATGWNNEVRDNEVVASVVRTSATVVTITLTAAAAYSISETETIAVTVPAGATTVGLAITAAPTFDVEVTAAEAETRTDGASGRPPYLSKVRRRARHWTLPDGDYYGTEREMRDIAKRLYAPVDVIEKKPERKTVSVKVTAPERKPLELWIPTKPRTAEVLAQREQALEELKASQQRAKEAQRIWQEYEDEAIALLLLA